MAKLFLNVSGELGLGGNWYGYSDQTVPTPQMDYLGVSGEMVGGYFNPYIRPGYLSPSVGTITATTGVTINAIPASTLYDSINDDYYFAERGQQIFKGDGLDDMTLSQVLDLGAGGTPVIMDLEIYQVNAVRKFFFVYETSGNLEVGISALPYDSGTDTPTWLTGTVSGAFTLATTSSYNFLRVADNSYAYLFADNAVHKIDGTTAGGTNGTVTANVLVFPPVFRLSDALDYRAKIFIVIHQTTLDITTVQTNTSNFSTPCGIYVWDRITSQINMSDYIPLTGVRAIKKIYVAPDGGLRLITVSSDSLTQVRKYTGSSFDVVETLGLGAAPQYADSLTVTSTLTAWLATDGSFYAHGPIRVGGNDVLAKLGQFKVASGEPQNTITVGAILYGSGNSFSASSGYRSSRQGFTVAYSDGTLKISKFYPFDLGTINDIAQNALAGNVYSPVNILPPLSKVNYIRLYHNTGATTGSTTQGTLSVYINQTTTANITSTITRNDLVNGFKYIPINQGAKNAIYTLQFGFVWPTGTTLADALDWRPRLIEVDYDPLEKLK